MYYTNNAQTEQQNKTAREPRIQFTVMLCSKSIYMIVKLLTRVKTFFQDYMAVHNPFYRIELDGNDTPEELHSVKTYSMQK